MRDNTRSFLKQAIDNNIGWCSAVCATHGSLESLLPSAWLNLNGSPPYYPNVITRVSGAQAEIAGLIQRVSARHPFKEYGIKDSFCDLSLTGLGFEPAVSGDWWGGIPSTGTNDEVADECWEKISSGYELEQWEMAWGGGTEVNIFKPALLGDQRIAFWSRGPEKGGVRGFISFYANGSIGLSNWFSADGAVVSPEAMIGFIARRHPGVPIVFWSRQNHWPEEILGVGKISPLCIWVTKNSHQ